MASLVVARAEGSTVKVVSVIYQKAPFCFFSLDPGANVTQAEGLRRAEGRLEYRQLHLEHRPAMMRKEGLDPNKLTIESIEPSARIAMLATRKIPAIDFFIITKPAMERAVKDAKVVTFLFADHGLDLYSNGIGAKRIVPEGKPGGREGASCGRRCAAISTPSSTTEEAAEIIQKHAKALNNQITVEELKIVEELTVTPDVKKNGIGSFTRGADEDRRWTGWSRTAVSRRKRRRSRRTSTHRLPAGQADPAVSE